MLCGFVGFCISIIDNYVNAHNLSLLQIRLYSGFVGFVVVKFTMSLFCHSVEGLGASEHPGEGRAPSSLCPCRLICGGSVAFKV